MQLLQSFIQHTRQQFPYLEKERCHLLLAVSGGLDSVVMTDLVHSAGFSFTIAHMNFQLRGEESVRDEDFVTSLGVRYNCEVMVKRTDTEAYAAMHALSVQEAARQLRYNWFAAIIQAWKAESLPGKFFLLTAHHAGDAIETMLMHFFRGTGIQGLTGIPPEQPSQHLVRPLLAFSRQALQEYAAARALAFVEDSSNAKDDYTRNFFRNTLLPQIREVFPRVDQNLLHNLRRFTEVSEIYQTAVSQRLSKLLVCNENEWQVPVLKWKQAAQLHTITWEIIKPFGFHAAQVDEVIRLLDGANGACIASPTHRIIRNRNWMIISTAETVDAAHILIDGQDNEITYGNGTLHLARYKVPCNIGAGAEEAFIDAGQVKYPLLLRRWKQGDYFYPLGMQKKKKISRFLIDNKLSKTQKEQLWVLESDRRIIWVIGLRIDDRFKISTATKEVLHITCSHMHSQP